MNTPATGTAKFTFYPATMYMTGSVTTTGLTGTAAHIHTGVAGQNGGVVIPLKGGPAKWDLPESLILTEQQLADMKAGKFYINVHTSANPGGAIRGQIKL